ncbi:hypothetical protein PHLCEN_2v9665 [Hermanssonia centrifuga]|uniref:Uncharacterized protein n=1 Tax=Hermanssonia centrifuga TaxID=98765 RepID=A0A2R6NQ65_9APHY|nr:hypothetical protein PHLCEN_2v9665 [Hermanssonia centrifuga]
MQSGSSGGVNMSRTSSVSLDDLDNACPVLEDVGDNLNCETQVDATWRVISAGGPTFKKKRLREG